jgi:hypothetical protein
MVFDPVDFGNQGISDFSRDLIQKTANIPEPPVVVMYTPLGTPIYYYSIPETPVRGDVVVVVGQRKGSLLSGILAGVAFTLMMSSLGLLGNIIGTTYGLGLVPMWGKDDETDNWRSLWNEPLEGFGYGMMLGTAALAVKPAIQVYKEVKWWYGKVSGAASASAEALKWFLRNLPITGH